MCINGLIGSVHAMKLRRGACLCRVRADAHTASTVMHEQRVVAWPGGQGWAVVPKDWLAGNVGSGNACVVGRGCAWQGGGSMLQSLWEMDRGVWHVE